MNIARTSVQLIVSRMGEMVASLLYFSFIGHFIVDSLSEASLAWAMVSFLTVVGVGFFSILLVKVAGSTDLNSSGVGVCLNISFRYAIVFGGIIVVGVFLYVASVSNTLANSATAQGHEILLIFSLSIPAIYVQIIIFNFFNATEQTSYEIFYTWMFILFVVFMGAILVLQGLDSNVIYFVSAYVVLRWIFVVAAFIFFNRKIKLYVSSLKYLQNVTTKEYKAYFFRGLPLALCFGGESLLFFILSFVSKSLGDASLSAYQATLHFLSIIYMISIGVGNATGIVVARHYERKEFSSVRKAYNQGVRFGFVILVPLLLTCFFLRENISNIYTFDVVIRDLIEGNILVAILFLLFEYVYIVTRMTLRSMGDFWVPTLLTILLLNIIGLALTMYLLSSYEYSVRSIFIALVFCSFILMLVLFQRLGRVLKKEMSLCTCC